MKNGQHLISCDLQKIFELDEAGSKEIFEDLFNSDYSKLFYFIKTNNLNFLKRYAIEDIDIDIDNSELYRLFSEKYILKRCVSVRYSSEFGKVWKGYIDKILENYKDKFYKSFKERINSDKKYIFYELDFDVDDIKDLNFLGDHHDKGLCVIELIDSCQRKIYYKPRSVDGFRILDFIFKKINNQVNVKLICPKTIYRKGYGWMQEMKSTYSCIDENDCLAHSYGALIAISQYLGLYDLHNENFHWTDNGLSVIDIDVMFRAIETNDIDEIAGYCMPQSTGLIPYHDVLGNLQNNININNLSTIDYISESYTKVLRILIDDENLTDFIKKSLNSLVCRYIPRNTATYSQILEKLSHDVCHNNSIFFLRIISRLYPSLRKKSHLREVLKSEIQQILSLDVPSFHRNVKSGEAHNFNGRVVLSGEDFFHYKLDKLRKGFASSSRDLLIQSMLINLKRNDVVYSSDYLKSKNFLFENNSYATYISYCMCGSQWTVFPVSIDLYSGLSGLLIRDIICNNDTNKNVILNKLASNIYYKITNGVSEHNPSFLSGLGGILLSLKLYEKFTNDKQYDLNKLHLQISKSISSLKAIDFYDGLAGIVCCYHLIDKYCVSTFPEKFMCDMCNLFVQRIKALQDSNLTHLEPGIAHGLSGICLALSISKKYVNCKQSTNINSLIETLLKKESEQYLNDKRTTFSAWCKGAAGMIKVREVLKISYNLSELKNKHKSYIPDMKGWCHGVHSNMLMDDNNDQLINMNKWSAPYRQFSLGLFTGEAGVDLSEFYFSKNENAFEETKKIIIDLLIPT